MKTVLKITLAVDSYIGDPYWPEREQIVSIMKASGCNRARSEDKRDLALRRYLEKLDLSMEDFKKLEVAASQPWYKDAKGQIYIPRHHFSGCLVQACPSAPAGCRFDSSQLRCLLQISDFVTDRQKEDRIFSRFILPTDGKGNPLSNQRRLSKNPVVENCKAVGTISFDATDVKQKSVLELLAYAGKYVGVGASRKMGYGRFSVNAHEVV